MSASPAIGPRSKKLPHFGEFVRLSPHSRRFDDAMGTASTFGFLISIAIGYGLYQWQGWLGILATVFVVLPSMIAIAEKIQKKRKKIDPVEERRYNDLNEVMRRLRGYLDAGKLHRYLEPVAAALLEESARNWKRIREALDGSAWSQADLPSHYLIVRKQAGDASDRAIEDLVLLMKSSIRSQPKSEEWQVAFTRIVGEMMGVNLEQPEEDAVFPVEFEPAREIASKLSRLANDIESATRKLLKEDFVKGQFASSTSIDSVLGELRAIDVAENELHQDVRA